MLPRACSHEIPRRYFVKRFSVIKTWLWPKRIEVENPNLFPLQLEPKAKEHEEDRS